MISALTCETQLLLVAASACWTLLTEEFSSQLHMLPAVESPLSLVRLKQSALWNLEERFKKGPARSFLCASLLLSPRLHFLSNSLTADMKRPADTNTDDEDAQLTGRYSALHPSCRHFLLHTSKQSDVRPERFSLVVWISFCLQLLMEAESLILRVGSSRRLTMRKDEGRAGETLTRVDVHVWVWIKNKTFHFISKHLKNPEITCLTWRNRVKPSAPENRADRSDRIHSWWRLKTVPVERKHRTWQNLSDVSRTKPERSDPSSDQSQTPAESGLSRSDQSPTGRPDQQECSRTSWFCWTSCADNKQLPVESCLNSAQSWSNWWHRSNMIDENQSAANEWEDRKWPQSSCNHTELCDAFTLINKFHNVW